MTRREHTSSSEIGKPVSDINKLQEDPILVPISDYLRGSSIFEKEDERESSNLVEINKKLRTLNDTGIYEDSQIAIVYSDIVGLWERIAWIYKKNVSLANRQIEEIKKVIDGFYITKKESNEQLDLLELKIKELKNKLIEETNKESNKDNNDNEVDTVTDDETVFKEEILLKNKSIVESDDKEKR